MPHETGTPEVGVIAEVTLFHTSLYPIRRRTNAGDSAIQTISSTSWVTLIGKAKVVDDLEKLRELRNTFAEAWMPEGPEDPNAVLIRVNVERGEYWDTPGGRVVSLVSLIQFHRLTGTGTFGLTTVPGADYRMVEASGHHCVDGHRQRARLFARL